MIPLKTRILLADDHAVVRHGLRLVIWRNTRSALGSDRPWPDGQVPHRPPCRPRANLLTGAAKGEVWGVPRLWLRRKVGAAAMAAAARRVGCEEQSDNRLMLLSV